MLSPDAVLARVAAFTPWQPLEDSWRQGRLPHEPGLYRLRPRGAERLHYVGQTGRGTTTLPKRVGMLRGVYGAEMPYRDPHTAGPALWADRQARGLDYEVSVLPLPELSAPERKGLEALVIALHRQEHGASPGMNFGRMPPGWRMSSANTAALARRGRRVRGGAAPAPNASHAPGLPPAGPLAGDGHGPDWLGLAWGPWRPLPEASAAAGATDGLYRVRRRGDALLTYIGEGRVRDRLLAHLRKGGLSEHRQREHFGDAGSLEASVVATGALPAHQRLELETDLIAAHLLAHGRVPRAQFLG